MRSIRRASVQARVMPPAWTVAASGLFAACAVAPATLPDAPRDAAASRAALATVVVDNRTDRTLRIGYDYLESGGGQVVIGRIESETVDTLPPVPAREPIILFARDESGALLHDEIRSLEIDTVFTWVIAHDATFQPPQQ